MVGKREWLSDSTGGNPGKKRSGETIDSANWYCSAAEYWIAYSHPQEPQAYIKQHAQELDNDVINNHIELYVNDFSLDLGEEGVQAVNSLLSRAEERGIIPPCELPLFIE